MRVAEKPIIKAVFNAKNGNCIKVVSEEVE